MKRNINIFLITLLLAFASCSFTTKTFENSDDKDKLLIQLVTYVLEQGHFEPKDMNDEFSVHVFDDYLNQLDPFKRYFYESDINEFSVYKNELDNQLMDYDLSFFNLTHERLLKRMDESKLIFKEVLDKPFDYNNEDEFKADYENLSYVKTKKEMKERWRQQLKFSAIANFHDLMRTQEIEIEQLSDENTLSKSAEEAFQKKSRSEMEIESENQR